MKYFSKKLHLGKYSDSKSEQIIKDYSEHLNKVASKLPKELNFLTQSENLHDGWIDKCVVDYPRNAIYLDIICGDNSRGYEKLTLSYLGTDFKKADIRKLNALCNKEETEWLYDEVDIENKSFIHRILFWPKYHEIKIAFTEFEFSKMSVTKRAKSSIKERFIVVK